MNLTRFIETFQEAITRAVLRAYPPLYTARNRNQWGFNLRRALAINENDLRAWYLPDEPHLRVVSN
jgi:hypothetical protein